MKQAIRLTLCAAMLGTTIPSNAQNLVPFPKFGTDGAMNTDIGTGADIATRHALQPDGKLLLGTYLSGTGLHIGLMRIDTACGALDASFGTGGKIAHTFELKSTLLDMTVLPDGRILCSGVNSSSSSTSSSVGSIYRFNSDGTPDLTFNGTGWRADRFDANSGGANGAVFPAPSGGYYTVGTSTFNNSGGVHGFGVMRYTVEGELDTSFSDDGKAWLPPPSPYFYITCETGLLLPDNSVLNIGGVGNDIDPYLICLTKFRPSGEPDTAFGSGGQLVTSLAYSEANLQRRISAVALPDGRFLLGVRSANQQAMVARLMADGSLDPTYGTGGISEMDPTPANDIANGLQLLPDGGTAQFGTGNSHYILKRTADGEPDATFGVNGVVTVPDITGDQYIAGGLLLNDHTAIVYGADGYPVEVSLIIKMTSDPSYGEFVDLGNVVAACAGESVLLDAGNPGSTYLWNDASTAQTLEVAIDGSYTLTVTNTVGCIDSDTVLVQFFPLPPVPVILNELTELSTTATNDVQWYLDGVSIPGATGLILVPLENGDYTVTDTDENGCSSTSEPLTVLNVGIGEQTRPVSDVMVTPNPMTHHAVITFSMEAAAAVSIDLRDALGRVVKTIINERPLARGEHRLALDMPMDLAHGNYLLTISSPDGGMVVRVAK